MGRKPLFGMDPEQLDRLLSLGTDDGESDSAGSGHPSDSGPEGGLAAPEPTASYGASMHRPGQWIRRYKLLSVLGEGGMGVVFLAEQEHPIKRRVALKVIKPGMDSKRVVARFEAERQALALLDHPNIAHVLDAGTTENGRPYFVMEYVKGAPVTEHCDRHKLSIEKRLGLFLQICHAIQHAHQKGIIHRDIKPSNILVTIQEDEELPKIIDFGVAKAIGQPLTERTLFTEQGQIVGTPEYMSPEQATMNEQNIDIRSDIYSLGVLLYVLLTGVLPFDSKALREKGVDNLRQMIVEKDPKTPSTRLLALGEEAARLAHLRQTETQILTKRLRSELEWIPLKAMRKEPARRYRTASELADDIENYLAGSPLIAGPESVSYRARKFVQKKRATVISGLAILLVLILGFVVSTVMFFVADRERLRSERLLAISQIADGTELLNQGNRLGLLDLLEARATARDISPLRDSAARLWTIAYNFHSERLVQVMPEGQDISLSPDGRLLAIASGQTAQLWNMSSGRPHGPLLDLGVRVDAVLFSPDGKLLATTSKRGVAKLWDPKTGRQVGLVLQQGDMVDSHAYLERRSATFSPDGKLLANIIGNEGVQLWRTDTGNLFCKTLAHEGGVISVAFSPNGKWLATGCYHSKAQLWSIDNEESNPPILQHTFKLNGNVEKIAFSPDSKLFAADGNAGITGLWHTDTGQLHKQLAQGSWMHDMAFSPDGKLLATGSFRRTARLWDTETGEPIGNEMKHAGRVMHVAFSHDGKLLATVSLDGVLRLWDVPKAEASSQPLTNTGHVVFSSDGKAMITGGWGATRIWQVEQQLPTKIVPHRSPPAWHAISGNGKVEATKSGEIVTLRDTTTGKPFGSEINVGHGAFIMMALSPKSELLAVCYNYWKIRLWNTSNGQHVREFGFNDRPYAVTFSPDGKTLAVGLYNSEVIQWDVATGKQLGPPLVHEDPVWAVSYSPDGNILATISAKDPNNAEMHLWDVAAGPPYYSVTLPTNVATVARHALASFFRDGKIIIGQDGGTHIWNLPAPSADQHEMRLRTWLALGMRRNNMGDPTAIGWEQYKQLQADLK